MHRLGWQETEERLYEDLSMKDQSQKITVTDTAGYQAVAGVTGGYGMAFLGAVVTLCGVFFLCHNVLQISMAGDIRKLGLLNTIGATQRQLSRRQVRFCLPFCWRELSRQSLAASISEKQEALKGFAFSSRRSFCCPSSLRTGSFWPRQPE